MVKNSKTSKSKEKSNEKSKNKNLSSQNSKKSVSKKASEANKNTKVKKELSEKKEPEGKSKNKINSKLNVDFFKEFVLKNRFDFIAVFLLLIFYFSLAISVASPMHQPSSPMYGGDLFYQMGCVNHIKYGGDMFDNCNLLSNNPGYLPFYGILAGKLAATFDISAFDAELIVSYFAYLLAVVFSFVLFRLVSGSTLIACVGVLFFVGIIRPVLKYTEFGTYAIGPILILAAYLFYQKQNWHRSIFFGVILGISTITHATFFPAGYLYMAMIVAYLLNGKTVKSFNFAKILEKFKILFPKLALLFVIAFLISLLYWFEPLFISHAQTSPHYLEWNGPGDMNEIGLQIQTFTNFVKASFFNFDSLASSFFSIIMIVAFVLMFVVKRSEGGEYDFVRFSYLSMLAITFCYVLTIPILGTHFVPNYVHFVFGTAIKALFIVGSLAIIGRVLESNFKLDKKYFMLFIALLLLVSAYDYNSRLDDYKTSQWYKVGITPVDDYRNSLEEFVVSNTEVNDVFMTTKENGFVLNGFTGRKLVAGRRAQNDAFEVMDPREMELAIILYGNDVEVKKELLKKYDVKYLFWDYYWFQSEYHFDEQGRVVSWFDPLIAFDNETWRNELDKNEVKYFVQNTYVDPALKYEFHPKFDLIFISPENYNNFTNPWNPNLNSMLKEVWSYDNQGQKIAVIYEVNYD